MSELGCSYCGKHAINLSHLCICDNISEEKPTYEELEKRNKELEAEKEELKGPHTIEHEWTHEQFNSMFEKLAMMAVRISDKEVKKITMTCESDSQEVKWSATCKEEQSK